MGLRKTSVTPQTFSMHQDVLLLMLSTKKIILRELANLGITNASLFPEIDNIMKSIKNK
jgi:hypothetical protein